MTIWIQSHAKKGYLRQNTQINIRKDGMTNNLNQTGRQFFYFINTFQGIVKRIYHVLGIGTPKKILFPVFSSICFLLSCGKPSNSVAIQDFTSYNDTIVVTNSGMFYECCKVISGIIVLKFPSEPYVDVFNSEIPYKIYKVNNDAIITFSHYASSSTQYKSDLFESNIYCSTPKEDCVASEVVDENGLKISRIHCIDSNLFCMGLGSFDGKGYTFLKVEDYRSIPNEEKEAFAAKFLSSFEKKDTIFHFTGTVKGQLDTNRFDQCVGKAIGQVIIGGNSGNDELVIAVEKEWYDDCAELYSLAECIIDDYFLNKGHKQITLVAPSTKKNNFERLATFIVRENTDVKPKDEREMTYNFVDCIWLNESFAKKLYDAESCERYHYIMSK